MNKRNEDYDGEERSGLLIGILVIAAVLTLVALCFSFMVAL